MVTVSQEALLANDVDLDGDSFGFSSAQNATNGTVSYNSSTVSFTIDTLPASDFGTEYTTIDGSGYWTRNIDISDRSDYGAVNDSNASNVVDSHLASVLVEDSYVGTSRFNYYDYYTLDLKAGETLYVDMDNVDDNSNVLRYSYSGWSAYDPASAYGGSASESDDPRDPYME